MSDSAAANLNARKVTGLVKGPKEITVTINGTATKRNVPYLTNVRITKP